MGTQSKASAAQTRTLSATLAIAFFFLSVVVLLLYSSVKTYSDFKSLENVILSRQQLIARDAAKTVSGFMHENFSILETSIWLADLDSATPEKQRTILRSLLGLRPAFHCLILLDAQNRVRAQASRLSKEGARKTQDFIDDIGLVAGILSDRTISPVFFDPSTSEPMVSMAVPVTDVFGDFQGTLIAEINLKPMFDLVEQLTVGRTGYVYVADRKGNLLAFYDTARVLRGENVSQVKAVADFIHHPVSKKPQAATRYTGIRGATVVGTYVPLKTPDWAVIAELPWQEAYQNTFRDLTFAAVFTLIMALLTGVAGVLVSRRLSAPVKKLTETATRIADGERELQAEVAGPDEVAHLAMAFNSMTAQLRRSLVDLEDRYGELKKTEAALSISEERLRLALEGTSDGIWDWDVQTNQAYFSPRYYTMMGYSPGEFPACYENWRNRLHPEDRDRVEGIVNEAVQARGSFEAEFRFQAKDGNWRWILARGKVVELDPNGKAIRMAGSHSDITSRKQAEETLRKYERIVSVSQDLMGILGLDYTYEAVNERILTALDKKREEVVGRTVAEVRGENYFREIMKPWLDQALAGNTVNFETTVDLPAFGRRAMEMTYLPIFDHSGRVEGVVLNARDVTENRKLHEQLIQSQKIESIGTLAGGVAHEINNPINGIMNYAQLIMDRSEKESPARQMAREIIVETERVANIVRNLLTFARDEKQSHSPALISDIVSSSLSLIQTVMRHDQIDLQIDIPEDLPSIKCRSQHIQQVVMNLMTNARDALNQKYPDYSPEKILRVFARLNEKKGRRFIRITVEDSGPGISPQVRARIFDPFFTTKPKDKGTGLGLSITYGIVRDHRGELSVESQPGQYTRFHVDLPVDNGWELPSE